MSADITRPGVPTGVIGENVEIRMADGSPSPGVIGEDVEIRMADASSSPGVIGEDVEIRMADGSSPRRDIRFEMAGGPARLTSGGGAGGQGPYDIRPGASSAVVRGTEEGARGYQVDIGVMAEAMGAAGAALAHSPLVRAALDDYTDRVEVPALQKVTGHTASAVSQTGLAILAYQEGDAVMGQTADAASSQAITPPSLGGMARRSQR